MPASEAKPAGPNAGSRRARASDILLTRDAYKIEPGWACRAEPGSGVGDVPQPGAASSSLGAVVPPDALRLVRRIVLRERRPKKTSKIATVAVLRVHRGGGWRQRPMFCLHLLQVFQNARGSSVVNGPILLGDRGHTACSGGRRCVRVASKADRTCNPLELPARERCGVSWVP